MSSDLDVILAAHASHARRCEYDRPEHLTGEFWHCEPYRLAVRAQKAEERLEAERNRGDDLALSLVRATLRAWQAEEQLARMRDQGAETHA